MSSLPTAPVEKWRGFDPGWRDVGGLSYRNFLVRGHLDEVLQALRQYPEVPKHIGDLLQGDSNVNIHDRNEPMFVYQLRGHEWTQVDSCEVVLSDELAQNLSCRLGTMVFIQDWEDVACASVYALFDGGELVEAYSMLYDNPIYRGEAGETQLRWKLAEGWQISSDHTFAFFTRRGTKLNIESPEECHALMDRIVKELGMFVAFEPWFANQKSGRVELTTDWKREDFAAAKVFYTLPTSLTGQPPDCKLRL